MRACDRYIYVYNIYDYYFLVTYRTIAPGAISDILNVFYCNMNTSHESERYIYLHLTISYN